MTDDGKLLHHAVFIVRLDRDDGGGVSGVIERVRTGEKARVDSLDGVGQTLAAMLARDEVAQASDRGRRKE
jgi:hypothetical protein